MKKNDDALILAVSVAFLLLAVAVFAVLWFYPLALMRLRLFFPDLQ